jgi:hypothetical protein
MKRAVRELPRIERTREKIGVETEAFDLWVEALRIWRLGGYCDVVGQQLVQGPIVAIRSDSVAAFAMG